MSGSWRRSGSDEEIGIWRHRLPESRALPSSEPMRKLLTANSSRINLLDPAGFWSVAGDCMTKDEDGLTEFDRIWLAAKDLVAKGVFLQASCYTPGSDYTRNQERKYTTWMIYCYVENYLEIDRVISSADEFRKKVHYPYTMYLRTNLIGKDGKRESPVKYMYCVDGDIYEDTDYGFKLLRFSR